MLRLSKKNKQRIENLVLLLIIGKDDFTCPTMLGTYIQGLEIFQPLSMLLLIPHIDSNLNKLLLIITRPEIALLDYIQLWGKLGFIFVLVCYLIHKILLISAWLIIIDVEDLKKHQINQVSLFFIGLYYKFIFQLLSLSFSFICMHSYVLGSQDGDYITISISIFLIILLQFDVIIALMITEPVLTYKLSSLDRIKTSFLDLLSFLLKVTQIILYGIYYQETSHQTISLLIIFISLIEIINQYKNNSYGLKLNKITLYSCNIFQFIFSFCYIIQNKIQSQNLAITQALLLAPIIVVIIIEQDQKNQYVSFIQYYKYIQNAAPEFIFQQFINIINQVDDNIIMGNWIIQYNHQLNCYDQNCICQYSLNLVEISCQTALITEQIQKSDILFRLKALSHTISLYYNKAKYYYQYCILLFSLGYLHQVVEYCNFLTGQNDHDDINRIYNIFDKQWSSSHNSQLIVRKQDIVGKIEYLQKIRLKYLKQKAQLQIKLQRCSFYTQQSEHERELQLQYHIQSQKSLQLASSLLQSSIKVKIQIYTSIIKSFYSVNPSQLYEIIKPQLQEINTIEIQLLKCHSQFKHSSIARIICLFYAELKNDYFASYIFHKLYVNKLNSKQKIIENEKISQNNDFIEKPTRKKQVHSNENNFTIDIEEDEHSRNAVHILDIKSREQYSSIVTKKNTFVQFIDSYRDGIGQNQTTFQLISQRQNQQQDFFNQEINEVQSQNSQEKPQELDKMQIDKPYLQSRPSVEDSSCISSKGLRASFYFKKFELIFTLLRDRRSQYQQYILIFVFFMMILSFLLPILQVSLYNSDLRKLLDQINVISLYGEIMGPHDLFFSMRRTLSSYHQNLQLGYIDQDQYDELTSPYFLSLGLGFQELKDRYFKILKEKTINDFLNDNYVQLSFSFSENNMTLADPINLRESIYLIISYQHDYEIQYCKKNFDIDAPYQAFTYANYFKFHETFESITNSMHDYTKQYCDQISNKWYTIWLVFQILFIGFGVITVYYQNSDLNNQDAFASLLNHLDTQVLQNEIMMLKQLSNQIDQSQRIFDQYDVEEIEKELEQKLKNKQEMSNMKVDKKKIQKKIGRVDRLRQIAIIILLQSIFLAYSLSTNQLQQSYMQKYLLSTDFYNILQQMKVRSGSLFLYKEIIYQLDEISYIHTEQYRDEIFKIMDKSIEVIQQFLNLNIKLTNILVTDYFQQQYNKVQLDELCKFIQGEFNEIMSPYCQKAFESVLNTGLTSSLNYLINSFRTQKAINNFTSKDEHQLYELEGGQIINRVFFTFADLYYEELVVITQNQQIIQLAASIVFIFIVILITLLIQIKYSKYLKREYEINRLVLTLIPLETLLLDSTIDRSLKEIQLKQEF